jgi:hypothetical protein
MRKITVGSLIVAIVWIAAGCHTAGRGITPTWPRVQAEAIRQAGERLGVAVETDNVATFSQGGATFTTATARSWRTSAATDLPGGVDFAVAYLDSPGQGFASGFYTLRAFAEPHEVGTVPGHIQVLNASRAVMVDVPATIDVRSMTLPPDAARSIPSISITQVPISTVKSCDYKTQVCYCCTNGQVVCSPRLIWTHDLAAIN